MKIVTRWIVALVSVAMIGGIAMACGDDDDDGGDGDETSVGTTAATPSGGDETPAAGGDGGDNTVAVRLVEYSVAPEVDTIPAGSVTFSVRNDGPNDPHEFVIIKSDLAADALSTAEDGSVIEEEVDLIDEVEELPVGGTEDLTVDLEPGAYVLICNIVEEEEGQIESHYQLGMRRAVTVE